MKLRCADAPSTVVKEARETASDKRPGVFLNLSHQQLDRLVASGSGSGACRGRRHGLPAVDGSADRAANPGPRSGCRLATISSRP